MSRPGNSRVKRTSAPATSPSPHSCFIVAARCTTLSKRGNPSGGNLAPFSPDAQDALSLFQSSYLFREGVGSLVKATGSASCASGTKDSSFIEAGKATQRSIGNTRENYIKGSAQTARSDGDTDVFSESYKAQAFEPSYVATYPLGKRGRGNDSNDVNPSEIVKGKAEQNKYGRESYFVEKPALAPLERPRPSTTLTLPVPHGEGRNSPRRPGTAPTRRRGMSAGGWAGDSQSEVDGAAVLRTSVDDVLLHT